MKPRTLVLSVMTAAALAACSSAVSNTTPERPAPPLAAQAQAATGTLTITVPRTVVDKLRGPRYISSATATAALFIDTNARAIGTTSACTSGSCTIAYQTTAGPHTFKAEIANSANVVLAQGEQALAGVPGSGNNFTITLNGVAGVMTWESNTSNTSGSITGVYAVEDSSSVPITTAGGSSSFDNGTLSFGTSAFGFTSGSPSFAPPSQATPDATGNNYAFTAACGTAAGTGTFSVTAASGSSTVGLTAAQLSDVAATYPSSALNVSGMHTYSCTGGAIVDNQAPPQTLYLRTTASTVVTGSTSVEELSSTQGSATNTSSSILTLLLPGTWQFVPGTTGNLTSYTLAATPDTKGWIFDGSTPGTYDNGNWTFTFEGLNTTSAGTAVIKASLWVVTATTTAVTSTRLVAEGAASPAFTPSTSATTATVTIASPGAVTLGASQYLYLEVYLDMTSGGGLLSEESISLNDNSANASRLVTPPFFP